jgi:hypothetical protein
MRVEAWESRLAEALRDARSMEFDTRRWNCALFARHCVMAVTGRDVPVRWLGSLSATADAVLPRVDVRRAQRGDVVLAHTPEPSLGVCVGRKAAFVTASGLTYYPMRKARIAWSV